jgi:hypothetical protein
MNFIAKILEYPQTFPFLQHHVSIHRKTVKTGDYSPSRDYRRVQLEALKPRASALSWTLRHLDIPRYKST